MLVKEHTDVSQVHSDVLLRTAYKTVPLVTNKSEKVNEQNQIFSLINLLCYFCELNLSSFLLDDWLLCLFPLQLCYFVGLSAGGTMPKKEHHVQRISKNRFVNDKHQNILLKVTLTERFLQYVNCVTGVTGYSNLDKSPKRRAMVVSACTPLA